jgi:4a-hydroxytetrahydrobiopterin dehydratase
MAVLTDSQIKLEIGKLPGWLQQDKAIQRTFEFPDFKAAMRFVNQVAEAAEQANHHPDIDIRYNKVTMSLISHDSGGVTQRDVRMAGKISQIAGS